MKSIMKDVLKRLRLFSTFKAIHYFFKNQILLLTEFFYRFPNPFYKHEFVIQAQKQKKEALNLKNDGIVILKDHLNVSKLEIIKKKFSEMIESIENSKIEQHDKLTPEGGKLHPRTPYKEQGYDSNSHITFTNDPFKHVDEFLDLALDEFVLGIISQYIGKRFMLQQSTASRYYPLEKNNFGSWQWHHDSWGRKINVMVLLSDVSGQDQFMSFMKGSHKLYHGFNRTIVNDRFTQEEVEKMKNFQKIDCIGSAGTVFIFDANGLHRGNRSKGAVRDTIINQYTAGRYLWSFDLPSNVIKLLNPKQFEFLKNNPNINFFDKRKT